jgi:murein DD-endopeptidase MepM/ murein hydrolase activator NlpD
MFKSTLRPNDKFGSGKFGASRGKRTHNGIDLAAQVLALKSGTVTKIGYPYGDDLFFRYVQITDEEGIDWRYFYVQPTIKKGSYIEKGQAIGVMQCTGKRYPEITPHVHLEIKKDGQFLEPDIELSKLK